MHREFLCSEFCCDLNRRPHLRKWKYELHRVHVGKYIPQSETIWLSPLQFNCNIAGQGERCYRTQNWKCVMAFIHLGNSVNSVFVIINTRSPDLTVWTDWVQTKFWLATGFCVYIVHKAIERFLSNAVERQRHHVGSAIAQGQGVCATRSFSKSKYLAKVWSMSSFSCFWKTLCW